MWQGKEAPTTIQSQQLCLAELGARLSDVFGADRILWVEGPTEDKCFPLILESVAARQLAGTEIVPLRSTGEVGGKNADLVIDIYNRLSRGDSLIPPALAFIFDRECLTDQRMSELKVKSRGLAVFLPKRMFESYLLYPPAVAAVMNNIANFSPNAVKAEDVDAFFVKAAVSRKYYCTDETARDVRNWTYSVDAAAILKDAFSALSETRVSYDKVEHGFLITKEIIKLSPEVFRELAEFLAALLAK